jgi:hypothetical protein
MNGPAHRAFALPVGMAASAYKAHHQPLPHWIAETILGGPLGALLGASFPDVIEPATTPNHRGPAHAVVPMGAIGFALWNLADDWQDWLRAKADEFNYRAALATDGFWKFLFQTAELLLRIVAGAIASFIGGYASHLALDATTPRGLPLLTNRC